jgi:ABC-type branched-subunit amino acid transport system ATPase component
MARLAIFALTAAAAGIAGQGLMSEGQNGAGHSTIGNAVAGTGCNIKGNVSMNTGERIYHVPGQKFYSETIITAGKGERWFCSEDEARAAGWRKARR